MRKIRLLLVLMSLFIGFSVYADTENGQGEKKVYILYRDSNGEMATGIFDPALYAKRTGHVAFYIVPEKGEPYVIDAMPKIGITQRTLGEFKGDGKQIWVFDPGLTPEQTDALIAWVKGQIGKPYAWTHINQKGPDKFDCVGFVNISTRMTRIFTD